jgi:predicted PurR-regulated permease PerM
MSIPETKGVAGGPPDFRSTVETLLKLGLLGALLFLCLRIVSPFATMIAWGVILAVALHPAYRGLASRLGGRDKSAASLLAVLMIAIPIGLVAVISESVVDGARFVRAALESGPIEFPQLGSSLAERWPALGRLLEPMLAQLATHSAAILSWLAPHLRSVAAAIAGAVGRGSIGLLELVAGTVVAAALLVYAAPLTVTARRLAARVVGERGDAFVAVATSTIRSVAKGVIGVAFIQATLAGIGMFAIGVPGAGLWALLALILAIVQLPVVLLMLPMILWAFATQDTLPAALFAGWAIVVGVSDNILKPLLLGRGTEVPMMVVLVGSIGGMLTGGVTWLFVGPVVLAVGYEILRAWLATMPNPGTDIPSNPPTSQETPK